MRTGLFHRSVTFAVLMALVITVLPMTSFGQQETPPPPSKPRTVHFPKPVEKTLKNGLRVIVIERSGVPLVSAQMLIKTGAEADPPQLAGLANMTASLLTKGTTKHTAPEIAEAIERLGGSLSSTARWDASTASIDILASKVEPGMEILAETLRQPTFSDEEIERLRQQTLDELSVSLRQPGSIARLVATRVVFGESPYGHPITGTPETITKIKRDDIVQMHKAYYRPDNAILVFGGDIKPSDAFKIAEKVFDDWQKPSTSLPSLNSKSGNEQTGKPRVIVIDKPDAGQAAVIVARTGLRRTDPDYFRGITANSVLGGGYSSRLNQEIRIKRGLSYGAGSSLDVRREIGPFSASAQTKNESAAEVASLILAEIDRLSSTQITEEELTPRKAVLIGNFARTLETADGLASIVASLSLYGLSLDEINKYINEVQSVTAGDVQKFAEKYLDSKSVNIIIVGNAKMFLDSLRAKFPNVEVIPESELDFNSANLHKTGSTK